MGACVHFLCVITHSLMFILLPCVYGKNVLIPSHSDDVKLKTETPSETSLFLSRFRVDSSDTAVAGADLTTHQESADVTISANEKRERSNPEADEGKVNMETDLNPRHQRRCMTLDHVEGGNLKACLSGLSSQETADVPGPCGEGKCRCTETKADCSGHNGTLNYIPELPSSVSYLDLSNNALGAIERGDFFENVTGISTLDLSENGLRSIAPETLSPLTNLITLDLSRNHMDYENLIPVLSLPTLEHLDIASNGLGPVPEGIFYRHPMKRLKTLDLSENPVQSLNMSDLAAFERLSYLSLNSVGLMESSFVTVSMPGLKLLELKGNAFYEFFESCRDDQSTSMFPDLTVLQLSSNHISEIPDKICLPKLQILGLEDNPLKTFLSGMFSERIFPSLHMLLLDDIEPLRPPAVEKGAFDNPRLKSLSLTMNHLDFSGEAVDPGCFDGSTSITHLDLSYNDFSHVTEDKFVRLFRNFTFLKVLVLKSAHVGQISGGMFEAFQHLEELQLNDNKLTSLPDGAFDSLAHLKRLQLSNNRISVVKETAFGAAVRGSLQYLDLSENPFLCSCDVKWFQHWLEDDPSLFYGNSSHEYMCDNVPNTALSTFVLADQACLMSHDTSFVIIETSVFLLCVLLLGILLYRYRWHIRLLMFEARRGREYRWRRLQEQHFLYDVFVCYDSHDVDFVMGHLVPELEGRLGLRLCVHQRDFVRGNHIVENIMDSVETSKTTMMLFSRAFAESLWCQFELQLCLSHALEHDDWPTVVLLEDIPSRDLTPAMMAVMKTTTYIEWADEPDARASFWGRLQIALREIMPGVSD